MPGKHNAGGCGCCECVCSFVGGFVYNDAGLLGSICLLQFAVGSLQDSSCATLDVETADITVVIKRNGTTITDPLIYDTVLNIIYWERWKPTAGDVYTADVELTCGADVVTQSYEFTIPTPANTSCVCCTERIPDYLVISGGSGCCDMVNGTWALSLAGGSCAFGTRTFSYVDNDIFTAPSNPCDGGECYQVADGSDVYYFWKRGVRFEVVMPATAGPDNVTVTVSTVYRVYRLRSFICSLFSSSFTTTYTYTISCVEGNAGTPTGGSALVGTGTTFATPCSSAPAVELFFQ